MDRPSSLHEWWTPLGVRLRHVRHAPGPWNWLFFPGLPGIGSECLIELVQVLRAPGTSWLVDLPGSGSNIQPPGAPADPYRLWPDVLIEAVDALPNTVAVGHSTGGEYLLSVPAIESRLSGVALISSAPDSGWIPTYAAMRAANPLPEVDEAAKRYDADPTDENLRDYVVATAPWAFAGETLTAGRNLLRRAPHNHAAAAWCNRHFHPSYISQWWPRELPTLVISGRDDRRIDQTLWDDPYYRALNITHVHIADAAHFPWLEQPTETLAAFAAFTKHLGATAPD